MIYLERLTKIKGEEEERWRKRFFLPCLQMIFSVKANITKWDRKRKKGSMQKLIFHQQSDLCPSLRVRFITYRVFGIVQTFQSAPHFSCCCRISSHPIMNSVKLLPLSIFVEIADAVKVNFEGFKMLPLVNCGRAWRVKFLFHSFDCLFISSETRQDEKANSLKEIRRKSFLRQQWRNER